MSEESTQGPATPAGVPTSAPPHQWGTSPADPQTYWEQPAAAADGWSTAPASVSPQSGAAWSPEPQSGSGWGAPAFPDGSGPQYQPRIPPTPPKPRKPVIPVLVGVVVAALVAGTAGYFLGAGTTGDDSAAGPKPTASPAGPALFEAAQSASNKAKLDGELAGLAEPWLSSAMGDCVVGGDKGAPPLGGDESRHVACRYGSAWVHFLVYKTDAKRTENRNFRLQLNINSDEVAPGVHDPSRTTGGVSGAPGKLIEYAYRRDDGPLCGISWERDADPLAVMLIEVNCEKDLGGKWEPLRDLWQRHS